MHPALSTKVVTLALFAYLPMTSVSQEVAKQSDVWNHNTRVQKLAFIRGFCTGARVHESLQRTSDLFCSRDVTAPGPNPSRFCGLAFGEKPHSAVAVVDAFYTAQSHSDVPFWASVVEFNDRVCEERNVLDRLKSLQERGSCLRSWSVLVASNVSKQVRDNLLDRCKAIQ